MTIATKKQALGKIMRALAFAAAKHRDQRRKDAQASPYINHPIALAAVLADECGLGDTDLICAALLHDTIEDTETSFDELVLAFGGKIASIVQEVSDDRSLDSQERKRLQIEHAPALSADAKRVKLADKICNLRDIAKSPPTEWTVERKREYFDWAARVIDGLRGVDPALEALFDEAMKARPSSRHPAIPGFRDATRDQSGGVFVIGGVRAMPKTPKN